jgi:NADH-quinone oxidoreductase subunit C
MTALELAQQLKARFPGLISEPVEFRGEITLMVSDAERMPEICAAAKQELGFDYLVDITSVDNYGDDPRFTLVYHLYGYGHPDLRRILMWEGYPHYPLRKDFPLAGKPTDVPEVAFTNAAPLAGGPFVTVAGGKDAMSREPRVRLPGTDALETNARLERRQDTKEAQGQSHGPGTDEPKH